MHCLTFGASAFRQLLSVLLDMQVFLLLHALRASFVQPSHRSTKLPSPTGAQAELCLGEVRLGTLYVLGPCTAWRHAREQRERARARAKRKSQRHAIGSRHAWTYVSLYDGPKLLLLGGWHF